MLREVTENYGICCTQFGDLVSFNKFTLLDGGSLHINNLSTVFRAGDWVNITGASRFHAPERPDIPFTACRMEWFKGTNDDFRTRVGHGVFLSRVPEPVFGIQNYHHVDVSPSVFTDLDPLTFDICRTGVLHYKEDRSAPHGRRATAVIPLASSWEEKVVFWHCCHKEAMLAMGATRGDTIYVPRAVLAYRGLEASEDLAGQEMSAVTSPILPYEGPSQTDVLHWGVSEPLARAFLLFPQK